MIATTTLLVTGSADNTAKLWDVQTGKCLKTWEFKTAVKRVEFSEDDTMVLCVTEQRMGFAGSITVLPVNQDINGQRTLLFSTAVTHVLMILLRLLLCIC